LDCASELGVFYQDEDFASLYAQRGQPAQVPGAFGNGAGDAICAKICLIDKQRERFFSGEMELGIR